MILATLENRMGRGQTHRHTDRRTCRLSDQLGPEGRVGENIQKSKITQKVLKKHTKKDLFITKAK